MPRVRSAVAACLALCCALAAGNAHAGADRLLPTALLDRALAQGTARVLVELAAPAAAPDGPVPDEPALAERRRRLRALRDDVRQALAGTSHRVVREFSVVPLLALEASPEALRRLQARPDAVVRITEDTLYRPRLAQSGPLVGAPRAWAAGFDGTGTVIAILDTGVDRDHPFLAGKVVEEACYSSTTSISVSLCPGAKPSQVGPGSAGPCRIDGCDHGTHVAGIAAGDGDEAGQSFSGIARGAKILPIQIYSRMTTAAECEGAPPCVAGFTSDLIAALERVYELRDTYRIAAANLSLSDGNPVTANCDGDPRKPIIDALRAAGIATVIASGNSGSVDGVEAPACISTSVSVAATTKGDAIAYFSDVASFLSLLAPGDSITSSVPGGGYKAYSGTSLATPHVAGAFAILRQARPTATVGDLLTALRVTGVPITDVTGVVVPRIQVDVPLGLDRRTLLTAFVQGLYANILGRTADPASVADGVGFLETSCSPDGVETIALGLLESEEFRTTRAVTITTLVQALYRAFFGRDPDAEVRAAWSQGFRAQRVAIAQQGFFPSPEFRALLPDRADVGAITLAVTRFYREILGREPDPDGLGFWVDYIRTTGDVEGTALAFIASDELEGRAVTLREFVRLYYRGLLARDPDPGGGAAWEQAIGGSLSAVVRSAFIRSDEFEARRSWACGS
jgi:subtilisin family serine protease